MRFTRVSGKQDADTMRELGLTPLLQKLKSKRRNMAKKIKK